MYAPEIYMIMNGRYLQDRIQYLIATGEEERIRNEYPELFVDDSDEPDTKIIDSYRNKGAIFYYCPFCGKKIEIIE